MRGFRVMMTTDAVGGVWSYATTLARELAARGCRVTLVVMGPAPEPERLGPVRGIAGLDLEVTDLALEWLDPAGRDMVRAAAQLTALERRLRPDVVHLNGYREAAYGWRAPALIVAHSCVRSWWRACRGHEPQERRWRRYMANVAAGLAAAEAWAAPSRAFRDEIWRLYRPPRAGLVVRNGIAPLPLPAHKAPIILAAGRMWDEAKNLAALVAAADGVPWPIRVAGSLAPPDPTVIVPAAGDLRCLGELPRTALLQRMAQAAVYAAPSVYEPFGLTVLEAAASGCALALADIPSFRELWDGAAVYAPPRDGEAWRAVLRRLCENEAWRRALQLEARRRARRYRAAAMTAAYRDIYAAMIAGRPEIHRASPDGLAAQALA